MGCLIFHRRPAFQPKNFFFSVNPPREQKLPLIGHRSWEKQTGSSTGRPLPWSKSVSPTSRNRAPQFWGWFSNGSFEHFQHRIDINQTFFTIFGNWVRHDFEA